MIHRYRNVLLAVALVATTAFVACDERPVTRVSGDVLRDILVNGPQSDRMESIQLVDASGSEYTIDVRYFRGRAVFLVPKNDVEIAPYDVHTSKLPVALTVRDFALRAQRFPGATREDFFRPRRQD